MEGHPAPWAQSDQLESVKGAENALCQGTPPLPQQYAPRPNQSPRIIIALQPAIKPVLQFKDMEHYLEWMKQDREMVIKLDKAGLIHQPNDKWKQGIELYHIKDWGPPHDNRTLPEVNGQSQVPSHAVDQVYPQGQQHPQFVNQTNLRGQESGQIVNQPHSDHQSPFHWSAQRPPYQRNSN
jgi:hypothetical protein